MRFLKNIPFILKFITLFSGNAEPIRNNNWSIANSTMPIARNAMSIVNSTMSISNNVSSSDLDNIDYTLHKSHNVVSKIEKTIGFSSANPEWIEALELKEADEVNHSLSLEATDFNQENVELTEVNEVAGATGFNPENIGLIQVKEVTYGLSYQDNDDGSSKVKLLISHESKTYEWDMGINVENKYEGQLSLTLVEDSGETDKIGIIFPEKGLNKKARKKFERLSFNVYKVNHSKDGVSVEHSSAAKLQKNANDDNDGNLDNSYGSSKVVKTDNDDFIVVAHNFKERELIAWLLESDGNGQFKPLRVSNGIMERKLSKFDKPGQLAFSGNTMSYSQRVQGQMGIFPFNIEELAEKLRDDNKVDECLLANRACIINTSPYVKSEGEISFMQYVTNQKDITDKKKGKDVIAFIEEDQSSKKQILQFFEKASGKVKLVYEFTYPVKQLYVRDNGQGDFTVTAVSGKSVITFNVDNLFLHSNVTFIPVSSIKSLSDFAGIINGHLTPEIISNSTVAPTTTKKNTEQPTPSTPRMVTEGTSQPTSAIPTVTNSATKITETTKRKESETSTATIASSPVTTAQTTTQPTEPTTPSTPHMVTEDTSQPATLEAKTTTEPTKVTASATPNMVTEDTSQTPTSNGVQTTLSGSTQRVSTISSSTESDRATLPSSTEYERSTPLSTTIYPSQTTFSPRTQPARAGRSNDTGAIAGGTIGALVVLVFAVFGAYKFIQRRRRCHYTQPALELESLSSRSSSDPELGTQSTSSANPRGGENILMTRYVPENANSDPELGTQSTSPTNSHDAAITEGTPLDNISVGSTSLASSSSPGSSPLYGNSRSPLPISFSLSTNSHGGESVPMAQARPEETPLNSMSVEDVSPASGPLPGNSRSSSPISFSLSTNSHGGENVPMAQARPEEKPLNSMSVEDVSPASGPLPGNSRSPSSSCLSDVSILRKESKDLSWDSNDLL